jgi:hypothetical protein
MTEYVIHKVAFFWNDDCFSEHCTGSFVAGFDSLEEAEKNKEILDIQTIQDFGPESVIDFIMGDPNQKEILDSLSEYFNISREEIADFNLAGLTKEEAIFVKEKMDLSFHNIVEYTDNQEVRDFYAEIDEDEKSDLMEFPQ